MGKSMATWQQGINSGGFLAGIGAQNENAPKASDIRTDGKRFAK